MVKSYRVALPEKYEPRFISGAELAKRLGMSYFWVKKNKHRLVGTRKIMRRRVYDWLLIEERLINGQSLFKET